MAKYDYRFTRRWEDVEKWGQEGYKLIDRNVIIYVGEVLATYIMEKQIEEVE